MTSSRATRIIKGLVGVLTLLFLVFAGSGLYLYGLYQDLPDVEFSEEGLPVARTSVVYASDGSVIAEWHGVEDRTPVTLEQIPETLRDAVIAVEDERFYEHNGVDVEAIVRAFRSNAEAGTIVQGGSTITQQLVKLLSGEGERTLVRKMREALLAYELEARTDKDRVLEAYLNLVYFGHGWYGVEAASQNYFGKAALELDVAEAAMLAAIIRSPGAYSPKIDPEAARQRRDLVIGKMEEQGYIDPATAQEARNRDIVLAPPRDMPEVAPHFVELVKQDLIDRLGVEAVFGGGLRVHTTLDPSLQALAEQSAASVLPSPDDPDVAIVCIDHSSGAVRAMVGGRDFEVNQFNLAAQGRRQPGSAFKPFVLTAAMASGLSPERTFSTAPYSIQVTDGTWNVENYEGAFPNTTLTLRDATVWSVNTVFARLVIEIGAEPVVEMASRMGIETTLSPNPAIALGGLTTGVSPLEMASAYGTIASGGVRREPMVVSRVADEQGGVLYEAETEATRVIPEALAVEVSKILHEVITRGTGTAADIGVWAAGKTGTTQSYRDAWFVGYSGNLVTSVWVGYAEGQVDMLDIRGTRVSGGTFPARIWRAYMSQAIE
jgi:penicillin-binding protein 1A